MEAFVLRVTGERPGSEKPQRDLVYAVAASALDATALVRLARGMQGERLEIIGIISNQARRALGLREGEVCDAP